MLGHLFTPFEPLYLRKVSDVAVIKAALTGIMKYTSENPIMAVSMTIGLYESHKEIYLEALEGGDPALIQSQIDIMRAVVKTSQARAEYADYLIVMWSSTGDLQYLQELVARTRSPIEEVSGSAQWHINVISKDSETFRRALDTVLNSN